jgi:hypothetical protein
LIVLLDVREQNIALLVEECALRLLDTNFPATAMWKESVNVPSFETFCQEHQHVYPEIRPFYVIRIHGLGMSEVNSPVFVSKFSGESVVAALP